jgi:hypothetical protein
MVTSLAPCVSWTKQLRWAKPTVHHRRHARCCCRLAVAFRIDDIQEISRMPQLAGLGERAFLDEVL